MSLILEALQKARRERVQDGDVSYGIIERPAPGPRRRGSRLLWLMAVVFGLMFIFVCAGALTILLVHSMRGGESLLARVSAMVAGAEKSAVAAAAQEAKELPVELAGAAGSAEPPPADLPAPVPISQLNPEQVDTLAPPYRSSKAAKSGFVLGSIMWDEHDPIAVLNGITVREGRIYGDFKVLKIEPNGVVVQREGTKPITLTTGQ